MNRPAKIVTKLMVAALSIILPMMASADGDAVDEIKDVSIAGHVTVNVVRGEVRLVGWDKPAVQVTGTLDSKTKEFIFEVDGDETVIEVKIDNDSGGWFGSDEGSDLTIHVPGSSRMEFNGASTEVDILGLDKSIEVSVVSGDVHLVGGGRVTLQTVSGDISLKNSTGRVKVASVSGDVLSESVTGEARYTSVSGDILIQDGGEELMVESVSGEIEVINGATNTLSGQSVSGDILIGARLLEEGSIEFSSISGGIELRLEGDVDARFDIETGSGSITNNLTNDQPSISKYLGDESLQFTIGDGEGEVIMSTRSGDVLVEASQ